MALMVSEVFPARQRSHGVWRLRFPIDDILPLLKASAFGSENVVFLGKFSTDSTFVVLLPFLRTQLIATPTLSKLAREICIRLLTALCDAIFLFASSDFKQ